MNKKNDKKKLENDILTLYKKWQWNETYRRLIENAFPECKNLFKNEAANWFTICRIKEKEQVITDGGSNSLQSKVQKRIYKRNTH